MLIRRGCGYLKIFMQKKKKQDTYGCMFIIEKNKQKIIIVVLITIS